MANLWRTQRPRFPLYQSDGFGRDYYIKYTNGGYWENQFNLTKKPDYERPRYKNFHSLYHMAAPFKYWGNGSGRENYILKCNGFHHDQKPLCSYQLTDFLRNNRNIKGLPDNYKKKAYLSVSETKYYQKLRNLEKKLVKRLYTEPMKEKRKKIQINAEDKDTFENKDSTSCDEKYKTFTKFNKEVQKNEEIPQVDHFNTISSFENNKNLKIKNTKSLDSSNWQQKLKNKIRFNYYNSNDNNFGTYNNDNTYYGNFDHKKAIRLQTLAYISPKNNLKYIDSRGKYNRELKFKQPSINERLLVKKIKIV